MIKAIFYRDSDKRYKGFSVEGHAGYADSGKDIICSAVTALTFNTINSITALTDNECIVESGASGSIKFKFKSGSDDDGQLLVSALTLGLTEICKEYGDKYLRVYFKEV